MNSGLFQLLYTLGANVPLVRTSAIILSRYAILAMAVYLAVYGLSRWYRDDRHVGLIALVWTLVPLTTWLVAAVIKLLYVAERPFQMLPNVIPYVTTNSGSFPSVHAAVAFGLATAVYYFSPRLGRLYLIIAFLVGVSRIIVGVHWPIDVLGGFILGGVIAYIFVFFTGRSARGRERV